jgi:hypothetical protein
LTVPLENAPPPPQNEEFTAEITLGKRRPRVFLLCILNVNRMHIKLFTDSTSNSTVKNSEHEHHESLNLDQTSSPSVHCPFMNSLSVKGPAIVHSSAATTTTSPTATEDEQQDIIPPSYEQLRFTTDYENASIVPGTNHNKQCSLSLIDALLKKFISSLR